MTLACEGSATQALDATRCGSFDFARRLASLRMTFGSRERSQRLVVDRGERVDEPRAVGLSVGHGRSAEVAIARSAGDSRQVAFRLVVRVEPLRLIPADVAGATLQTSFDAVRITPRVRV